jgi:hypothetical protein
MPPSICSALPFMNPDFFGSPRKATNCRSARSGRLVSGRSKHGTTAYEAYLRDLLRLANAAKRMELRQRIEACSSGAVSEARTNVKPSQK